MADIPPFAVTSAFCVTDSAAVGPLVFASPHSGRDYPQALLRRTRLPLRSLRKGEDRYVDLLIGEVDAPRVLAGVARAWIDLNRDPAELDPLLFDTLPSVVRASDRVAAGLGVIPRAFAPGQPIYTATLPLAEAHDRIAQAHMPYHAAIAGLLARARARHGYAVLIDCHSMPSQSGCARVVLGDLHGRAAASEIADAAAAALGAVGLPVSRNIPYAGAYTLERHGRPADCVHALQIEIDRALYLDSERMTLLPRAAALTAQLARFAVELGAVLERGASARAFAVAAE